VGDGCLASGWARSVDREELEAHERSTAPSGS